jgi:tetratricopeptide (TPR) repeat protein
MLYELLSGVLPFDSTELRSAGFDGIRRRIREQEPPKPSTRLKTLGDSQSTESARRRRVDLPTLRRQLSGDLDWITMKALEKDLGRRYGSPREMAMDIRRHLKDEPVFANPPSTVYRARKFVRRHRVGVAVTAAGVLVLLAFAVTTTIQAGRIAAERELYLEQLVENAMLEALSGNLDTAEAVIKQADKLGTNNGRIHMLQGQVALQRGQPTEAIEHLEQATELLPDNVAAQGMLAQAWDAHGLWTPYFRELSILDTMTPVTFHDYLSKGAAESKMVPGQGMDLLDEAVRIRPGNAVARLIRAQAGWRQALHTFDQEDVERSLDDAHFAKELLPGNPVALVAHLKAQLTASILCKASGQLSKSEAAIEVARTDAEALKKFDDRPNAYGGRASFFQAVGRPHEALEETRRGLENISDNIYLYMGYGFSLARLGEYEEAYEHMPYLYTWFGMFFLADLPDGRARARAYIDDRLETAPPIHNLISQVTLRLLGAKDEAVEVSRTLRRQLFSAELPDYLREWYLPRFDFACDYLTEEEFLETAGDHPDALASAHYYIGMNRLAEGDPNGARKHFQESVEAMPIVMGYNADPVLAGIFLAHLERDPDWTPSKSLPDDEAEDALGSQPPDSAQDG